MKKFFKSREQILLVKVIDKKAKVILKEKFANKWRTTIETIGFIGKNGLGKEREGDNKTPIGIFDLGIAFGIKKVFNTKIPYIQVNKNMYWVNDINSKYYNKLIEIIPNNQKENLRYIQIKEKNIDWKTAEHIYKYPIEYKYAIEIKYNTECIKGKGSAIFLHVSNKKNTSGCIAIESKYMKKILRRIQENTKIYINYS